MGNLFLALVVTLAVGANAFAETTTATTTGGESTKKIKDLEKERKPADIDEQITNARMRAETGSKNKYSLSIALAYQGGKMSDPFGKERPEIYGDPETRSLTDISGGIDARYRFNASTSMTLGASLAVLTPFQGDVDGDRGQFEVNNPEVGVTRAFKLGSTQNNARTWMTFGTERGWADNNLNTQWGVSETMLSTLKSIPLTYGASLQMVRNIYANDVATERNLYAVGLYPFMEYAFNDMLSARTVFGYFNWRLREVEGKDDLKTVRANSYQSIGVGISVTRDVYLYPNVQFLPEEAEAEKTNVAFSTTINI